MKTSSSRCRRLCALVVLALALLCAAHSATSTGGALILDHADANENVYNNSTGDFTSHLRGNVRFRYDEISISADDAVWQKADGIIDFRGNITVLEKGQIMTCDRLHFAKDSSVLSAIGNVVYQDSARITFMKGRTAEYSTKKKECTLMGGPVLTRIDSTSSTDTLFIRGRTMVYNDSLKIATVLENVRVTRGDLAATCRNAKYYVDGNYATLRVNPVINYEKHRVVGDSVDLFFSDKKFESASVMGNTHGHYAEVADSTKDTTVTDIWSDSLHMSMFESGKVNAMKAFGRARGKYSETVAKTGSVMATDISSDSLQMLMLETGKVSALKAFSKAHGRNSEWNATGDSDSLITHIWGDSLRVRMSDAGKIRTMRAFGNVLSQSFTAGDSARANEVSGRTLMLTFNEGGKIERAIVRGEAKSRYYIDEADGGGCNVAFGDQIVVTFNRGKARTLHVKGGAKGTYLP